MTNKDKREEGGRVEVTFENGVRVETTYDADGNVVKIEKRIKPKVDPRRRGPVGNQEKRPS